MGAGRLLRRLWSAAWLAVLVAGVPAVLVAWVGWPLPDRWPDRQQVADWVEQPLTGPAVMGALAVVAWLVWAVLAYALLVGLLRRLRRWVRWLPRLPLPRPVEALAGGLFGAALVGAGAASVMGPPPPHDEWVSTLDSSVGEAAPDHDVAAPAQGSAPGAGASNPGPAGAVGVGLPDGGWLPDPVAAATSAAASVVWWRRRRAYTPGPPAGPARDDADLAPLPPTVAAVQAAWQQADGGDGAGGTDPTQAGAGSAGVPGVIGQWAGRPLRVRDLPAGGVGLVGVGAADAARGVLAALLVGASPDGRVRVLTTTADLAALLGADTSVPEGAGLRVAAGMAEMLGMVEDILLERTTRAAAAAGGRKAAVDEADAPVVVLATVPADPDLTRRLAVLLTFGHRYGVAGLLVGAWAAGVTWQVDHDGAACAGGEPAAAGRRLCTLTGAAAADLLALVRDVTGPVQPPTPRGPQRVPADPAGRAEPTHGLVRGGVVRPAGDDAGAPVRLQVLGPVAVSCRGVPVPVRRSAAAQILVLLAVHRDGATSQELAGAIWPQLRAHAAAGRTYTSVSELRRALRAATGGADVLVRSQERYRLDPDQVEVDLWALHDAVRHAATALLPDDRHTALRAVIGHYGGELAAGQRWPWLAGPREAVRRHVLDAYATLAAAQPQQAVTLLQEALRIDPVNEALHRQAIRAVAATGDQDAVRGLLQQLTRHLAQAGLQPDPATLDLAVDLQAQPPGAAAPR
jgi:DNA-binding SARP family transcriptional activator